MLKRCKRNLRSKTCHFNFWVKLKLICLFCSWQVEKALRTVASKEQEDKEQRTTSKSNLVDKKVITTLKENTENKNSLKHKSALKGISQDLLNKVHVHSTWNTCIFIVTVLLSSCQRNVYVCNVGKKNLLKGHLVLFTGRLLDTLSYVFKSLSTNVYMYIAQSLIDTFISLTHSFVDLCLDSSERSKENRGKHDKRSVSGQEACHEGTSPWLMQNTQSISYIW